MNRKWLVAALLSGALPFPAFAQDIAPVDDSAAQDDGIVVTAARTILPPNALPLTIDVISKDSLDQQVAVAGSVIDAVANLTPSFSPTRQKLSGSGETLRGRSPLYAINGIPQSTPIRDGSRDGYTIDPFFLDRVELIYGSNALQGIGATGGVVNQVVIKAPREDGLSGRVLVQGSTGNFENNSFGGKLGGLIAYRQGAFDATGGVAYETRGLYYDGAGRRVGIDNTQGDVQDSKSLSFFARLGYDLSSTARLELFATRFNLEGNGDWVQVAGNRSTGLPTSSKRGEMEGEMASNRVETVNLTLTDTDLGGGNLIFQAFFNRSRDIFGGDVSATFQDANIAPVGTLFDQSANRSRKLGARVSYERQFFDALNITLGFDSMWDKTQQEMIATGRYWVPPTTFRTLAPFGQANLKLFDGILRVAGGARWENGQLKVDDYVTLASYNSARVTGGTRNFDDLLINGGVIIEPMQGIRAYASYAEGYSIADVGRILRSVNGRTQPNFRIDEVNVTPVISNNRELGIEIKRGPLDASASYFWSTSKDGGLLVMNSAGVYDVQRQRIEIQGFEINLAVELPVDGLKLGTGYAHLSGRTDSNKDDKVDIDLDGANISPDRVNLWASYNSGPVSARVQAGLYLDRRFDGAPANTAFSGYTLTDAVLRYELPRLGGITLAASNLFDVDYVTYNSQTIRSTVAATDNARFFTGRGRTVTLGWDYRF
ncbi:iron complex outermembrane receptor protein [Sphingopyxis panaciterrae]|uniref:TonB-dependent receptor n=1 Tax=Sphingopyxis panaciterrae TaxID=363841 RepID=UPI0014207DC0|nr:TonB-dependent receptor [Sphingopyxis panaciterrae]NIJ39133.1 iron complex outermembrane receptor protein [Sphingopyxis panaciterrae]